MPIPDFQTLMLPLLRLATDGNQRSLAEARESLSKEFELTESDRSELLPSGRQRRFDNRVAWAKVYLEQAKLLSSPKRGYFTITDRGREVLAEVPKRIDIPLLDRFDEFREFRSAPEQGKAEPEASEKETASVAQTPEEMLEHAYQSIRAELALEILNRLKASSPQFFEKLVVELLLKMGYGGSRLEAGAAIGGAGDEGIDGIISEDRLGLDIVYIQAKRWTVTVGRPEVQRFVGALHGKRARKGVFLTTGTFSAEAQAYVSHIDPRVVLIDGRQLAEYMIDLNLGVTARAAYEIKRIDSDFFSEDE